MKYLLIAALLLSATVAQAQTVPTELNIKVSPTEADLIWKGLRKLPVEEVEGFMAKVRQQFNEQTQPKAIEKPIPTPVEPKKE